MVGRFCKVQCIFPIFHKIGWNWNSECCERNMSPVFTFNSLTVLKDFLLAFLITMLRTKCQWLKEGSTKNFWFFFVLFKIPHQGIVTTITRKNSGVESGLDQTFLIFFKFQGLKMGRTKPILFLLQKSLRSTSLVLDSSKMKIRAAAGKLNLVDQKRVRVAQKQKSALEMLLKVIFLDTYWELKTRQDFSK